MKRIALHLYRCRTDTVSLSIHDDGDELTFFLGDISRSFQPRFLGNGRFS